MRQEINIALQNAIKQKNEIARSTLRLMLAVIKDADIAARSINTKEGLSDEEILQLLETMIKQRKKSEMIYRTNHQNERAERELAEIAVIQTFLPDKMSEEEIKEAIGFVIEDQHIQSPAEVKNVIQTMKKLYPNRLDMQQVATLAKSLLQEKFS